MRRSDVGVGQCTGVGRCSTESIAGVGRCSSVHAGPRGMVCPLCSDAAAEQLHGHSLFKIPHAPFKDVPALQVLLWCACWARVRMYAHFVAVKLQSSVRTVAYVHAGPRRTPCSVCSGAAAEAPCPLWSCQSQRFAWQAEGCSFGKLSALLEAECHMARLTGADPVQVG